MPGFKICQRSCLEHPASSRLDYLLCSYVLMFYNHEVLHVKW